MRRELRPEQKIQESKYILPYHWFFKRESVNGRVYFGYMDLVLKALGENLEGKRILDAGCGDGRVSYEISKKGAEVWGIDFSNRAISFAKLLAPEVNFVVGDLKKIPFENNFFDDIVMVEVLEHIPPLEIPQVLGELKRVLSDDGRLIITVPSILASIPAKHFQHFSEDKIRKTLGKLFSIKKVFGQDKNSFVFRNIYRLIENRFWHLKLLAKFFNLYIYPRHLNKCSVEKGRRIVVVCGKK